MGGLAGAAIASRRGGTAIDVLEAFDTGGACVTVSTCGWAVTGAG